MNAQGSPLSQPVIQSESDPTMDENREDVTCFEGVPDNTILSPMSMICQRLKENWKVIFLGQCLSFLLASGGAAQATLHLNCGLSSPTFTMALVYFGLSVINLPILVWKKRKQTVERLQTHDSFDSMEEEEQTNSTTAENLTTAENSDSTLFWPICWYFLLAFFDVQANAITMLAFRYTTLTSITLFDALAIPSSMIISRCVVFRSSRRYFPLHYLGVIICMAGVVLNVFQDYESDVNDAEDDTEKEEYPHKLWGDVCAIVGGILYGLNDVLTELTVSKAGATTEYLGMLGACGFAIAFSQSLLLERADISAFFSSDAAECSQQSGFLLLSAFVGVTMCSYVGASYFLILSEAAFFNLSLLTGDLWSVIFSIVAERIVPKPLFFAALAAVLSGVVVYEMAPSPALEKENGHNQSEPIEDRQGNDGILRLATNSHDEAELELSNISIT